MKKCKYRSEQERYYARKNREMDFFQANNRSFDYADKTAYALTEKAGATLGADPAEGILDGVTEGVSWAHWSLQANTGRRFGTSWGRYERRGIYQAAHYNRAGGGR
ncbi:TPA: hypothetical protein ACIBGC_005000, partial [Salmonella enterica subsp. enterica serovar Eastbourne]